MSRLLFWPSQRPTLILHGFVISYTMQGFSCSIFCSQSVRIAVIRLIYSGGNSLRLRTVAQPIKRSMCLCQSCEYFGVWPSPLSSASCTIESVLCPVVWGRSGGIWQLRCSMQRSRHTSHTESARLRSIGSFVAGHSWNVCRRRCANSSIPGGVHAKFLIWQMRTGMLRALLSASRLSLVLPGLKLCDRIRPAMSPLELSASWYHGARSQLS